MREDVCEMPRLTAIAAEQADLRFARARPAYAQGFDGLPPWSREASAKASSPGESGAPRARRYWRVPNLSLLRTEE